MYIYTPLIRPLFWVVMGFIYALVIAGAKTWAIDFGIEMNWFKWLLAAVWYVVLSFSFAGGFTLIGEKEVRAGVYFLVSMMVITIVLGIVLFVFLL